MHRANPRHQVNDRTSPQRNDCGSSYRHTEGPTRRVSECLTRHMCMHQEGQERLKGHKRQGNAGLQGQYMIFKDIKREEPDRRVLGHQLPAAHTHYGGLQ
jgi:hypothetical protein